MADPWAFGWDALVALGTLALALVTYRLVRATVHLANTSDAEISAQWRPVLLARARVSPDLAGDGRGIARHGKRLVVWVENVGRGPAFAVEARILELPLPGPGYGVPYGEGSPAGGMGTHVATTMAPGDLVPFEWRHGAELDAVSGILSCSDMAGTSAETYFALRIDTESIVLTFQRAGGERPPFGP